jgi:hypothetical protein
MNDVICEAIKEKRIVNFTYEGKLRSVEPFLLGMSTKDVLTLSGWQLSGGSGVGWRDFHRGKMSNVTLTPQHFSGVRSGYNPHGGSFHSVVCCI